LSGRRLARRLAGCDFLFEPPVHTFAIEDDEAAAALAIALVTAHVVSELGMTSRESPRPLAPVRED
jgi:hypothetical protein